MVGGVWIGNDDYSSTNRMTGGSLPAMTWHAVMAYAHQGIEIKTMPGIAARPPSAAQAKAGARPKGRQSAALRPTLLTARGAEVLVRIERMMEGGGRALGLAERDGVLAARRTGHQRRRWAARRLPRPGSSSGPPRSGAIP